jgi:hypothetical protein
LDAGRPRRVGADDEMEVGGEQSDGETGEEEAEEKEERS